MQLGYSHFQTQPQLLSLLLLKLFLASTVFHFHFIEDRPLLKSQYAGGEERCGTRIQKVNPQVF